MNRGIFDAVVVAGVVVALYPPDAAAQVVPASVLACVAEVDDARRLACFDVEVARLAKEPSVAAAAPSVAAAAAAVPAAESKADSLSPEEKFGLRGELKREKLGDLAELSATATAIAAKPRGELVVTLDNGQVWTEIAPGSSIRLKVGDRVTIKAGSLGSFFLVAPNNRSSKVARLR